MLLALVASAPILAGTAKTIEEFNCGKIGSVKLTTSKDPALASGHPVFPAVLEIPSKKLSQKGFIHSSMGGNDRTFTKGALDNFRAVDEATPANPIMIRI